MKLRTRQCETGATPRSGIGIAVGSGAVRGVVVRRGRVAWAAETPVGDRALDAALAELFERLPVRGWPKPAVAVAVGPYQAQVRRLTRLPALTSGEQLAQVVRASVTRFFPHRGVPLVATGVRPVESGVAWGGAIDQPVVAAVMAACRTGGVRLRAIAPTVAALPHAITGECVTWHDGEVTATLAMRDGGLQHARSTATTLMAEEEDDAGALPLLAAPLAALGDRAYRFADAYAAAVLPSDEPLTVDLGREPETARVVPGWRIAVAALLALTSIAGAIVSPGIRARRDADHAAAELQALSETHRPAVARERELARVTGTLRAIAAFDGGRRPALQLLGGVARALPRDAMLVAARLDSAGGTMVALTSRTARVLTRLEQVPLLSTPEVVGPVTREWVGSTQRERVTVRFRWATR